MIVDLTKGMQSYIQIFLIHCFEENGSKAKLKVGPWRLPGREEELFNEQGMLGKDTGGDMPSLCRLLELLLGPLHHSLLGKLECGPCHGSPHIPVLYPSFE